MCLFLYKFNILPYSMFRVYICCTFIFVESEECSVLFMNKQSSRSVLWFRCSVFIPIVNIVIVVVVDSFSLRIVNIMREEKQLMCSVSWTNYSVFVMHVKCSKIDFSSPNSFQENSGR